MKEDEKVKRSKQLPSPQSAGTGTTQVRQEKDVDDARKKQASGKGKKKMKPASKDYKYPSGSFKALLKRRK